MIEDTLKSLQSLACSLVHQQRYASSATYSIAFGRKLLHKLEVRSLANRLSVFLGSFFGGCGSLAERTHRRSQRSQRKFRRLFLSISFSLLRKQRPLIRRRLSRSAKGRFSSVISAIIWRLEIAQCPQS